MSRKKILRAAVKQHRKKLLKIYRKHDAYIGAHSISIEQFRALSPAEQEDIRRGRKHGRIVGTATRKQSAQKKQKQIDAAILRYRAEYRSAAAKATAREIADQLTGALKHYFPNEIVPYTSPSKFLREVALSKSRVLPKWKRPRKPAVKRSA